MPPRTLSIPQAREADLKRTIWGVAILMALAWPALAASKASLTPDAINAADWSDKAPAADKVSPLAVKLQVLLDRAHFSPGEIDGHFGENVKKALRAYAESNGFSSDAKVTPEIWAKLQLGAGKPVMTSHTLTDDDVKGPFLKRLPAKMEDMKTLAALSYTSAREALGERFHMSPDLLVQLNPSVTFDRAGETINVVDVTADKLDGKIMRVEVDKSRQTVKAYAKDGTLLAFFPASVGSEEKPTPEGTLKVVSIDANPTYRYNPKYQFKGVRSKKPFRIQGGPNNPVGSVWIGLSADSYGIHGTAEPSRISKSESHGCVRLTNWDVRRLADGLKKGVAVDFVDGLASPPPGR
jgi:lipoprotein-anchoring transpeptidase ErfK/SrfK